VDICNNMVYNLYIGSDKLLQIEIKLRRVLNYEIWYRNCH